MGEWQTILGRDFGNPSSFQTAKSTHRHPQKRQPTSRVPNWGGVCFFAFFLGPENSHITPPLPQKIPPDEEGLLWGWCMARSPLSLRQVLLPTPLIWRRCSDFARTCHGRFWTPTPHPENLLNLAFLSAFLGSRQKFP